MEWFRRGWGAWVYPGSKYPESSVRGFRRRFTRNADANVDMLVVARSPIHVYTDRIGTAYKHELPVRGANIRPMIFIFKDAFISDLTVKTFHDPMKGGGVKHLERLWTFQLVTRDSEVSGVFLDGVFLGVLVGEGVVWFGVMTFDL